MYEYICLLIATVMWSFVGILSKTANTMVSVSTVAFSRFFFGVVALFILILVTRQKCRVILKYKWIWIAVIGKCLNYLLENIAFSMGYAYSSIIVWPVQTVFITVMSALFFKEEMNRNKYIAVFLCCVGIFLTRWNPQAMENAAFLITVLFILAGMGAGVFLVAQKMLVDKMSAAEMNFSVFLISSFIMATPMPFSPVVTGDIGFWPIFALVGLGVVTGISFYLNSIAIRRIPMLITILISNSNVLLSVLWSVLLFHEPVSLTVVLGCLLFIVGICFVYIPVKKGTSTQ